MRKILREMRERIDALNGYDADPEPDMSGFSAACDAVLKGNRDDTIRAQHESGMTYAQIAEEHGISAARVGQIVKGR